MQAPAPGSFSEVWRAFLRLGCTCFGGPVAHLGFFHEEFVVRRRWLSEEAYADLVSLCQFLPGPISSQVGMALGLRRGGPRGLLAAFLGFTLPSAALMIGFAYGVDALGDVSRAGWLRGIKLAAVAVVAQAVWTMATKLCPDRARISLALAAAAVVLAWPTPAGQVAVIVSGAAAGSLFFRKTGLLAQRGEGQKGARATLHQDDKPVALNRVPSRGLGLGSLASFFLLLFALPALAAALPGTPALQMFAGFYRTGSLVFGGGHVVLPLLQAETVEKDWIAPDRFLAGYGAAQAVPGPLFTFAGYLGAAMSPPLPHGLTGGALCLAAIFLPSALLVTGTLPFWEDLRQRTGAQAALRGANAAVVGLLLAALYRPVWTSAVFGPGDFIFVLAAFALLVFWRCPPWLVVGLAAAGGAALLR